jgi:aquaporin Z
MKAIANRFAEGIGRPVRSLAPELMRGDLSTTLIYVVGPLLGALVGVAFEWILKGTHSH